MQKYNVHDLIKDSKLEFFKLNGLSYKCNYNYYNVDIGYNNLPDLLGMEVNISGHEGGSCWGDESKPYYNEEVSLDTDIIIFELDKLGLINLDDMKVRDLLKFKQDRILKLSRLDYGYYGNYSNYNFIGVKILISLINKELIMKLV